MQISKELKLPIYIALQQEKTVRTAATVLTETSNVIKKDHIIYLNLRAL